VGSAAAAAIGHMAAGQEAVATAMCSQVGFRRMIQNGDPNLHWMSEFRSATLRWSAVMDPVSPDCLTSLAHFCQRTVVRLSRQIALLFVAFGLLMIVSETVLYGTWVYSSLTRSKPCRDKM
jgi:hypothetical protein